MVIEKICEAKIFWNELQQRWLKSVTCAIQFIFAVKCAMQINAERTQLSLAPFARRRDILRNNAERRRLTITACHPTKSNSTVHTANARAIQLTVASS